MWFGRDTFEPLISLREVKMEAERMSLMQIKELDMVAWLAGLGYEPMSVKKGFEYWYRSPLREEAAPSFKVNSFLNRWYDFGLATGGNLVDFGLRYYGCNVAELAAHFLVGSALAVHVIRDESRMVPERQLVVNEVCPIYSYPLKNYLHERGIPVAVADEYCCEINYQVKGKELYGIGFKNDAGGYEIRSRIAKSSSSPKDITTIRFGAPSVQVFEGFFDLLSWRVLHPYDDPRATDIVVLNSAALFDRALPFLLAHEGVHLWLDRDATGQRYRDKALSLGKRFIDESGLYSHFKDLNEWLCHKGEVPEKRQRLKVRGF
ncbi:Toprim domain-containing protein [Mucilaginibacter oryzae]|uniref:Toprim domain-containing protein n=1 Tax=Mucilaginibacter oryzae TaxID=468058 RepID=A0A316GXE3_9SPHI|nr:toprim domain-containing protein [Mucilaginibacter oryzae]PWK68275.1 Toprim domain-containing protein [Mucilaginibacter oryzae]